MPHSPQTMTADPREEALERLTRAGLKVTRQRMAVLTAMLAQRHHLSADELFQRLKPELPSLSLGTVYRVLESLAEAGLVRPVAKDQAGQGGLRFDAALDEHHHLVDRDSGAILDHDDDRLTEIIRQHLAQHPIPGYTVESFQLHLHVRSQSDGPAATHD